MKVKILVFMLVIFTVLTLAACDVREVPLCIEHVDADENGKCDSCDADVENGGEGTESGGEGTENGGEDTENEGGDLSVPCIEHNFKFDIVIVPTCITPARLLGTCEICNAIKHVEGSIDPDAHVVGDWIITQEATCAMPGERVCYCTLCNELLIAEQTDIVYDNHSMIVFDEILPTCSTTGTVFKRCQWCKTELKEDVPIDEEAHAFKGEFFVDDEFHSPICSLCGGKGEASGHILGRSEYDAESHYSVCIDCNGRYDVVAHDWEKVTFDPSYQSPGYFYYHCTSCAAQTERTEIDQLPQVIPEYTIPQGIECVYGSRLGDVSLPEGFSFDYSGLAVGEVGENVHIATYVPPNNTEGKYQTVLGIPITVTVIPATIEIECDFSAVVSRPYNGERVQEPKISIRQQHIEMITKWYCGDTPLDGAPCDAGEYRVVISVVDKNYTAKPQEHHFTIERAAAHVDTDFISDRGYTGEQVSFKAPEGAVLTYFDKDGKQIDTPTELGEYLVVVYLPGSKNYLPFEITLPFSVVVDKEAPVWRETHVYLPIDTRTYTLDAIDNGKVAYYHVLAYTRAPYEESFITENPVIEVNAGELFCVEAVDAAGNVSEIMYIAVQPENYLPTQITPANGSTVHSSYVALKAENATYYYISTSLDGPFEILDSENVLSLKAGQTYYWYASCGYTKSEVYSFNVEYEGTVPPTLISPENNAILTEKVVDLIGTSSNGATVFISSEYRPDFFLEYTTDYELIYGLTYYWYVEDADGNRSETREFVYMGNYGAKESDFEVLISRDSYAYHYVVVMARGPIKEGFISYVVKGADGKIKGPAASSTPLKYRTSGGDMVCGIYNLENGDTVYVRAVDNVFHVRSKIKSFTVDLEAPVVGKISTKDDGNIEIDVGSDNFGATYEYRIAHGDWIGYTSTVVLTKEEMDGIYPYVEVRAFDGAGNRSYDGAYLGESSENAPKISIEDHIAGAVTNKDVAVSIEGVQDADDFYFVNGERFEIDHAVELVLSKEGEYIIWTSAIIDEIEQFSAPIKITIDKTAPEFGELYYQSERMNLNSEYHYVCFDQSAVVESSDFEISYSLRGVNDAFLPYEKHGRVPLYNYYIVVSGYYYVDIMVTDAAGNSTTKTATLFLDVEPPIISDGRIKYEYDEETGENKCYIVFEEIRDELGYYYHMHFQIWDQNAYDNGLESIVSESFYTEPGESSYVYDASHLEDGKTYYFLAYVVDDKFNEAYSSLYYFDKQPPSLSTNE